MKRRTLFPALVLTAAACLVGCASSGMSPREGPGRDVSAYLQATQASAVAVPAAGNAPAQRLPIVRPADLAVAQIGEVTPPDAMLAALADRPELFADVQGISGIAPPHDYRRPGSSQVGDHLDAMLATARDIGADYLVVYGGTIDQTQRGGPLSFFDLTIVGAFVVPSRKVEAEAKAMAMVLDARTGRPVATATATAEDTLYTPTVGSEGRGVEQMADLRDETLGDLTGRIVARFEAME